MAGIWRPSNILARRLHDRRRDCAGGCPEHREQQHNCRQQHDSGRRHEQRRSSEQRVDAVIHQQFVHVAAARCNVDPIVTLRCIVQEHSFRAMGCQMLAVIDRDDAPAATRLAAVPGWFEAWEQQLSRFRADSALSRLNAAAGRSVVVPPELLQALGVALKAAQLSDGLVQPALLAALEQAGYDRSFEDVARQTSVEPAPVPATDWRSIALDRRTAAVTLPEGMRIDLGGVAKGWAADQAARRLAELGPALVDAGGDIAVSGPMADGSPWPIAIAHPCAPEESLGLLLLVQGAVATSGRDYRRWIRGGIAQHHIIDPRTRQPARTDVLAATIVAPDGPSAEMAAKVALILGSQAGIAWLDARPTLAGLLVLDDGQVLRSRRIDAYLDHTTVQLDASALLDAPYTEEYVL